ncbi:TBC1 domain family member 10B [Chanos chanos]|uniref:TBC1 domain family member 10B n=1 Tax=Chanos chanos TaxID=29144 RepID=A0A6J2VXW5_CHACN|nr:TBC1 domain family member 10A-like [Chanos chanos]
MAEISALSPSPPGMAEPPVPPSSGTHRLPSMAPTESPKCCPIPKSALYGDRAVMGSFPAQGGVVEAPESTSGEAATPQTAQCLAIPPPTTETRGPSPATAILRPASDSGADGSPSMATEQETPAAPPALKPGSPTLPIESIRLSRGVVGTSEAHDAPSEQWPTPHSKPDSTDTPTKTSEQPHLSSTPERTAPPAVVVQEPASLLAMPTGYARPAPDTLSYLESASLMSGTLESLTGLGEDGSSVGSDSEINGLVMRRTDKYGFLGGAQYSEGSEAEVRVDVARQREMKWLDMFSSWDKWISRRFQKVKMRCRKGIPSSLRAKAWQLLSNSEELLTANRGKFEELEREQGDPKWLDIIEKDLHRQFPFHEMFAARGGHGQQDLFRILKAYTVYRPDEGYCQAQAPVAAVLLMHMPAEQAFWCLVQICEKYLPGYYSAGLEAIQLDGEIFFSLLRRVCPMAYRHLKKFKIDPILYMTEWFMCIFSRTLPWACVLRVWDMFFCEGVKIIFRVGLVLLKQMLGSVDKLRELQGMYETMERLRNIPPDAVREDILLQEVVSLPVTEVLIEKECAVQVRKWRESRGELTHQPGRRLHGTRAIYEHKQRAASISSGGSLSFLAGSVPPPGPLRASSSLLSLPGFRAKPKAPFLSQNKKGSFSGASSLEPRPVQGFRGEKPLPGASQSLTQAAALSGGGEKSHAPHGPSPLTESSASVQTSTRTTASTSSATYAPQSLQPPPKTVSEQITPTLPSPTANNAALSPCQHAGRGEKAAEEEGKKKKRSKEDKKKEKEEEKQKLRDKKEREKAEKERLKKEKEWAEKEKKEKKGGKRKDKRGGGETDEKNGAGAVKDLA